MSDCHSASATERRSLQVWRSTRWRSWLKWLWTLAWTEANFLFVAIAQFGHSRLLGSQAVGCYYNGRSMAFQRLPQECQSRSFVALFRTVALENLALAIDRAPQAMPLAIALYEHRIKMPAPVTKARMRDTRSRRISDANIGPNRFHQSRTVSWQISMPRPNSRSSRLRSANGNRIYIITTKRITSGDKLKYRNRLSDLAVGPIYRSLPPPAILV